jgi:MFS family permease
MTSPAHRSGDAERKFSYKWIVAGVFVCAQFMDIMDTTIVNVALPGLARGFHASTASIEWVVLGYLVALAASIPASGWLGDRFGTKRVFLVASLCSAPARHYAVSRTASSSSSCSE